MALDMHRKIVQVDEFMVTKKTWLTHEWSLPKTNLQLDQSRAFNEAYAVILAVSRERGVELVDIHKKSITKKKFKFFLERLRQLNYYNDILLVMDNLSLHRAADMKERMQELGLHYAYTPVYSPQYNGIEEVIGMGKRAVKKRRLELIQRGEEENLEEIIREAFESIDAQQVAKCIARSLSLLALPHQ